MYAATSLNELKFAVRFDSSSIYSTVDPSNQDDINKLYGFADNNTFHHNFSARFGWAWDKGQLRLFGYVYNNGIVESKELTTITIGQVNNCAIIVKPTQYIFTVNELVDSLPRSSATVKAEGYKLYPYFGGDEVAPHNIDILIKDL